jgi:hypothetical protein
VEQKQDRRISVTGFAIEDIQAVNVDGAVGDWGHLQAPLVDETRYNLLSAILVVTLL